jgi:hypothetical protein
VKTPTAPSALACALTLIALDASLHLFGMKRAIRLARRLAGTRTTDVAAAQTLMVETGGRIAYVAAFYPRRALCLEQSLVLFVLLRRRGVPVDLRIGVQPSPFLAHAWVEWNGRPINESEEFVSKLAPFPSLGG